MANASNLKTPHFANMGVGKNYASLKQTIWRMSEEGELRTVDGGRYALSAGANRSTPPPFSLAIDGTEPLDECESHPLYN